MKNAKCHSQGNRTSINQSTGLIIKTWQKKKKAPMMCSLVKKGSFLTCCANSTMIALARSSNSSLVFFFCFFRVAATSESGLFFQSYNLSIQEHFFYVRSISKALTKLSKLITKVNVKAPGNPNVYHTNVEESVLLRHFMEPKVPTMCLAAPPLNEKLKYHTAHWLPTSS